MIIHDIHDLTMTGAGQKPLLIMFPFAGGSTYSYRGIIEPLEGTYDIICTELPDRTRIHSLDDAAAMVFNNWIRVLRLDRPYVLYGHSMGAMLAYLVLKSIIRNNLPQPVHLMVSGCSAPCCRNRKTYSERSSSEFWGKLRAMGGMPEMVLLNNELREYFEPVLRFDFKLIEKYRYVPTSPVSMPVSVLSGSGEMMDPESLSLWQKETTLPVRFITMEGDHFFIFSQAARVISCLKNIETITKQNTNI